VSLPIQVTSKLIHEVKIPFIAMGSQTKKMDITVSMRAFVSPAMPIGIKKVLVEYARKRVPKMKGRGDCTGQIRGLVEDSN
jgi:hypothetical protein